MPIVGAGIFGIGGACHLARQCPYLIRTAAWSSSENRWTVEAVEKQSGKVRTRVAARPESCHDSIALDEGAGLPSKWENVQGQRRRDGIL